MEGKKFTRREFIRTNSMTGLGAAFSLGLVPSLFAKGLTIDTLFQEVKRDREDQPHPADNRLYFDGFARIGPRRYKHPEARWSLQHLIEEMDHCSISGALVAYTLSVTYDPMYSNLELSEMLSPYPYLFPIWNVMPDTTGEFLSVTELGEKMREHDVRAVSLHPLSNGWDWKNDSNRELLEWLNRNRILTVIPAGELGGWDDVDQFLTRYASVPVLLVGAGWIEQRFLLPLVKKHRTLHISFDRFQINEGLEYFHENGHTDQLIFATDTPAMSSGAHRAYIDYADLPESAKAQIAGGNLSRLLGGLRPPALRLNPEEDLLMRSVRRGEPVPANLIDMHMHILHEGLEGAGGTGYRMRNGGPEGVFALLDRLGYAGGGLMSWNGVVSSDAVAGNETVRQALDAAPTGYWGLASFDPTHYSQGKLKEMIPHVYRDPRFIGMKPYHFYGLEYHDPLYDVWWEYGNEHRLYGLIHHTRSDFVEVENLAGRFPHARWIIAHAGGEFAWADHAISIMKKHPNVFAEVTLTPVHLGMIEYLVENAGEDRILYGSDLPMRDPRQQLGWVIFSRLPVTVKRKILAENAMNVIAPHLERLPRNNRPVLKRFD